MFKTILMLLTVSALVALTWYLATVVLAPRRGALAEQAATLHVPERTQPPAPEAAGTGTGTGTGEADTALEMIGLALGAIGLAVIAAGVYWILGG